ncbi:unnamed protein product [Spirodela intermedia]|uniref:ALOG domain-containing protein n=1 Tax=Spirodela intermedia TaxID=51605 RepID=A0A7I8IKE5_SPIIN|nr:unnamed protein product [Spirodela intermedia]CAA6657974.1 unnamed protein product [Spirodela intermedia]
MSGILPASSDNSGSSGGGGLQQPPPSRYESQKRRDWNTFGQYLKNHRPPLALSRCSGAHVLEFLRYLDQFGKTKVHSPTCPFFGHPHPPAPCPCPLRQAWGSLDALIGRLRAAFEENGGAPEANPSLPALSDSISGRYATPRPRLGDRIREEEAQAPTSTTAAAFFLPRLRDCADVYHRRERNPRLAGGRSQFRGGSSNDASPPPPLPPSFPPRASRHRPRRL